MKDNRTGLEAYRIIFWQPGLYEVRPATGESVQAEIREGDYLFGPPQMPAAALTGTFESVQSLQSAVLPAGNTTPYRM